MFEYWENEADKAISALLAYELNCQAKYDAPGRPSKMPVKGERMEDFATRYGTTVGRMKKMWRQVEYILADPDRLERHLEHQNPEQ